MTTLEKIKATGGIVDFGAVGSMPWGVYMNGDLVTSLEYAELMGSRGVSGKIQPVRIISARRFKRSRWLVAKEHKVFGITFFKKYHTGVLYKLVKHESD
jgi:hypothetical protein